MGCDAALEWILPWWWEHYSAHNDYPVAFADFGMSEKALTWCRQHGTLLTLPPLSFKNNVTLQKKKDWEQRLGPNVWKYRLAWFKKPLALLQSPFSQGIWLDLDCQVRGALEPLFHSLLFGADIGIVRDQNQKVNSLLPGEIHYNSGVIVFRQKAPILLQWASAIESFCDQLVGDQDILSRVIHLTSPPLIELPDIYNWNVFLGDNDAAVIHHFCNEAGKRRILESCYRQSFPH